MATCKDCLHQCYTEDLTSEETCNFFLDKAEYAPVVRCKDCAYWHKTFVNGKGFRICPASGMDITEDDFCSYGERRDSDG